MLKRYTSLNNKKGITLIALVITIVVLLILAGISINLTLGENGIISKASSARENSIKSSEQEAIDLAVDSCLVDNNNGIITSEKLQEELNKTNSDVTVTGAETLTVTFNKTGHSYEYKNKVDPDNNPHSVYAKLYTDGTVILSSTDETDSTRTLDTDYGDLNNPTEEGEYYYDTYLPAMWVKYENYNLTNSASNIIIKDQIYPSSTAFWYYKMENESFDTSNINFLYTKYADSMFEKCKNLTNIPEGLFKNGSNITSFAYTFSSCTSINSIPAGLFDNCSNVTSFTYTFSSCTSINSIPAGLFDNCPNVTSFGSTFYRCTSINSIPAGLFNNCSNVTNFMFTFDRCTSINSIPAGLFDNCPNVTSFGSTFYGCTSINSIPAGLFNNCSNVTNFRFTFSSCTSLQGNAPELWKRGTNSEENDYQGEPDGYLCFGNCTSLSNYELIPEYWGGSTVNPVS